MSFVLTESVCPHFLSSPVQFHSVTQLCPTLCNPMDCSHQASLSITNSWSLLKLMSNHLIFCHPLLLQPSIFPSIRVFSNESVLLIRQPKYWSFSFSISPSNECSGLISFSNTTVQKHQFFGTQISFFILQLSHPYMTTGKTLALSIWTFVGQVMSLPFNMLSRFDQWLLQEKEERSQFLSLNTHTEERTCEHTARRLPTASQEEGPPEAGTANNSILDCSLPQL